MVNIKFRVRNQYKSVTFEECDFFNNTSISNQGVLYISGNDDDYKHTAIITILNSKIHHNHGDGYVVYLSNIVVIVNSSNFTDNVASAIYLVNSLLELHTAIFASNTADNGGALYIEQTSLSSFNTTMFSLSTIKLQNMEGQCT